MNDHKDSLLSYFSIFEATVHIFFLLKVNKESDSMKA